VGEDLVAHLGVVLVGWRGRWRARRGSSAALGAGRRGGGKFRRGQGGFGQCAAGAAPTGSQGGAGAAGRQQKGREGALTEQPSWWPVAGHKAVGGVCGEAGWRAVPLKWSTRARAFYRRDNPLNSQYGASSTGAHREPGDGPVDNTECGSGDGMDSTWRGAASRGPRSAPHLGRRGLGTARGALTPRRAQRSRRRTRRRGAAPAGSMCYSALV
jgi:hypothetical protein